MESMKTKPNRLQLEEGGSYYDRGGKITGPMSKNHIAQLSQWPWFVRGEVGGLTYRDDGSLDYELNTERLGDLIRLVSLPSIATQEEKTRVEKADTGKTNPQLLDVSLVNALTVVNRVRDYGVDKYSGAEGWRSVDIELYDQAARRHNRARSMGEVLDEESGLLHLAHEVCNLLFIMERLVTMPGEGVHKYTTYKAPPRVNG